MPADRRVLILAVVVCGALMAPVAVSGPAAATSGQVLVDNDMVEPVPLFRSDDDGLVLTGAASGDPLGLVPHPDEVRRFSLGKDILEVWECPASGPVPESVEDFVTDAEREMTEYFSWLSNGRYDPDFIIGGVVPEGEDCGVFARANATGRSNGALFILSGFGGFAGPGFDCSNGSVCPTTYPDNPRQGFIGISSESWTLLAHEIGHMLSWPHSNTHTPTGSDYDNAIDLMSGNYGRWTEGSTTYLGTYPKPYATVAYNRYAAGWIDPKDVVLWTGGTMTVDLQVIGTSGTQAFVVDDGDSFFVLGARRSSPQDPFAPAWNGVEVYEVERCTSCWSLWGMITPRPTEPFVTSSLAAYDLPLPHVFDVGSTFVVGDAQVTVAAADGDSYTLLVESRHPTTRFEDVPWNHMFLKEVEWLASEGITKGCDPPGNSHFCPDDHVTRGQMAALLARALGYTEDGGGDRFIDDDASIFETDIDRLATAGVTKGCNPPDNTRYCPDDQVTRGQMAALLVRALGYTDAGGGDLFVDDDASIFEADIDRLATAGVTKGCNPPRNDRYCPNQFVTRAQMAAFLYRALH